jgi:Fe-S oxidoreductase
MDLDVEVLESGCCGMAGSFGYEKDKVRVSLAAGERVLLPRVREADATTFVVANGFSCRSQIEQETDRGALHIAEVLALAKAGGAISPYPERRAAVHRRAAQRRSMKHAAIVAGVVLAAALGLALRRIRRRSARLLAF